MIRLGRNRALVLTVVVLLVVAVGAGTFLLLRHEQRVPRYLDPANPAISIARNEATSAEDLLHRLKGQLIASAPPADELWITQPELGSDAAMARWADGRHVELSTFGAWSVPTRPTWSENPYNSITWQFYYQSLGWLRAPARLYEKTGDAGYRAEVHDYVLGWISASRRASPPSPRSWYDHAVAFRVDTLVELFGPLLGPSLTPSELGTVLAALEQHGTLLDSFLRDPQFRGHNHNLFHALSLYNLAAAFPELANSTRWKLDARRRISTLLPEMVDTAEGVSTEQAVGYHFLALRLFAAADQYLTRRGDGLTADERAVLDRMVSAAALMEAPDGSVPAIGDTSYGSSGGTQLLKDMAALGITTPISGFVLSRGAHGERPPDAAFFPTSGYAFVRPNYTIGSGWEQDLQLIVDTSTRSRAHGHKDPMNVLLSAAGGPLLIDSGGPYLYGNAAYQSFVAARAHNLVVNDDGNASPGPVTQLLETDDARHTVVAGTVSISSAVRDRRVIVLIKPALLLVIDLLQSTDGKAHAYHLLYHLPPGATTEAHGTAGLVTAGRAAMGISVASSSPATLRVLRGVDSPMQGWVTRSYATKQPAPVIEVTQSAQTGWFVTAVAPSTAGAASLPGLQVSGPSGVLTVTAEVGAATYRIHIDATGGVTLGQP